MTQLFACPRDRSFNYASAEGGSASGGRCGPLQSEPKSAQPNCQGYSFPSPSPIPAFFFLTITAFVISASFFKTVDTDIWWHLKSGEFIVQTKNFIKTEPFTYLGQGRAYTDVYWLFQVAFYGAYSLLGASGLALLKTLLILAAFFISLKTTLKFTGKRWASFVSLGIVWFIMSERFYERPELASFIFLSWIFYKLLLASEDAAPPLPWSLFLAQLIWVNTHGLFILGPILCAGFWLGALLTNHSKVKIFSKILIGSFVACLINPYGINAFEIPLAQFKHIGPGADFLSQINAELIKPWTMANTGALIAYKTLLVASFVSWVVSWRWSRLGELMVFLAFAYLSTLAVRNTALFALIAGPILAKNLKKFNSKPLAIITPLSLSLFFLWQTISYAANHSYFVNDLAKRTGLGTAFWAHPARLCNFIQKNQDVIGTAKLYHDYNVSGYFIFRLYPKIRGWIFPQNEIFSMDTIGQFLARHQNYPIWKEWAKQKDIEGALLNHTFEHSWELIRQMKSDPDWRLAAFDGAGVLILKKDFPRLDSLIASGREEEQKLFNEGTALELANAGQLFKLLGDLAQAERFIEKAVRQEPQWRPSWAVLAQIKDELGKTEEAQALYEKYINKGAPSAAGYSNYGLFLMKIKDYQKAAAMFEKAIREKPQLPFLHFNLGVAQQELGHLDLARRNYQKALELNPDYQKAKEAIKELGIIQK